MFRNDITLRQNPCQQLSERAAGYCLDFSPAIVIIFFNFNRKNRRNPVLYAPLLAAPLFIDIGLKEWIIIGIVAVILFGNRLPELGRLVGKGLVSFRKGVHEMKDELAKASQEPLEDGKKPDDTGAGATGATGTSGATGGNEGNGEGEKK